MIDSLYKIIEQNCNKIIIKIASDSHPIFKAHFPGNPILPAFCQIDIISKILKDEICCITKSKFISHILPDDTITFLINKNEVKTKVEILKENNKVSEIIYERI